MMQKTPFRRPGSRVRRRDSEAGVTVLEMLVVMLVAGLLAGMVVGIFNNLRPKMVMTNVANEVNSMFQKARLTAIRQNRTVIGVVEEETGGETESYNPTGIIREWFVLKTVDALGNEQEFSSYQMHRGYPPVHFWGPSDNEIHGPGAITFPSETLAYNYDGSVFSTGAVRIAYAKDGTRNTLEIAIPTQSGIPVVRKYLKTADRPDGAKSQQFFEQTVASRGGLNRALWKWY